MMKAPDGHVHMYMYDGGCNLLYCVIDVFVLSMCCVLSFQKIILNSCIYVSGVLTL